MDQRERESLEALRRASRRQMKAAAVGLFLLLVYLVVLVGLVLFQLTDIPYSEYLRDLSFIFSICCYVNLGWSAWRLDGRVVALSKLCTPLDQDLVDLWKYQQEQTKEARGLLWLAGAMSAVLLVVELAAAGSAYSLLLLLIHGGMMALWRHASARFGRVLDGLLPEQHTVW